MLQQIDLGLFLKTFLITYNFIVNISRNFVIHLSVIGYLGCFYVLAIVVRAAMNVDKCPERPFLFSFVESW